MRYSLGASMGLPERLLPRRQGASWALPARVDEIETPRHLNRRFTVGY